MSNKFACRLETNAEYRLGDQITLRFELINEAQDDYYVLKWHTPLEKNIRSAYLLVTKGGNPLPYEGILVKRGNPSAEAYIRVPAGGAVTETIDLSTAYDFSELGEYEVSLNTQIHDYLKEEGEGNFTPRPRSDHDPHQLSCNKVNFRIVEGGTPRQTTAARLRAEENTFEKKDTTQFDTITSDPSPPLSPKLVGGTSEQQKQVLNAHKIANIMTWRSVDALKNNQSAKNTRYVTWFGSYDANRFATVLTHYQQILNVLGSEPITYNCTGGGDCDPDTYAYTYPGSRTIYLCSRFWKAPFSGINTKPGTLVHELTHAVADTEDIEYGMQACRQLAEDKPSDAINNADSHEYFSESKITKILQLWDNNKRLGMIVYSPTDNGGYQISWKNPDMGQGANAIKFLTGDVNGDGKTDIIQLWDNNQKLGMIVYSPTDDGGYKTSWESPDMGQGANAIKFLTGDVNGNGKTDIIQLWNNNGKFGEKLGIIVYSPTDDGGYKTSSESPNMGPEVNYIDFLTGDLNGHRKTDIIHLWNNNGKLGISVYSPTDKGKYQRLGESPTIGQAEDTIKFLTGDIHGNGKTDIIQFFILKSSAQRGGISHSMIVYSDIDKYGYKSTWPQRHVSFSLNVIRYLTGDVNGDGKTCIIRLYNYNGKLGLSVLSPKHRGRYELTWIKSDMGSGSSHVDFLTL